MLSKLTLKKSKQTEKLKVITFFSVAHFGLLLPKTRLILAPVWPFLKNFWFRFRLLKDNSMMMINSTDFASNLQKNRKMWTISYLKPRQNCRFWKSSGIPGRNAVFFSNAWSQCDRYLQKGLSYIILFFFGLAVWRSGEVCDLYWATNLKEYNNKKTSKTVSIILFCSQIYNIIF